MSSTSKRPRTLGNSTSKEALPSNSTFRPVKREGIQFIKEEHLARFEFLKQRKLVPTHYSCEETLRQLGFEDSFLYMMENGGWTEFIKLREHTYRKITLELLSTTEWKLQHEGKDRTSGTLTFRLGNKNHVMSTTELNLIFGFPNQGTMNEPQGYDRDHFWHFISDDVSRFDPQKAKASFIRNPILRYTHKLMAHTIFARGDTGGIRDNELALLWCMVAPNRMTYNCGVLLGRQLHGVGTQKGGDIVIGGLITAIAKHLGVALGIDHIEGRDRINIALLKKAKILDPKNKGNVCITKNGYKLPLPNELTTVRNHEGLAFQFSDNGKEENEEENSEESERESEHRAGNDVEMGSNTRPQVGRSHEPPLDVWSAIHTMQDRMDGFQREFHQFIERFEESDRRSELMFQMIKTMHQWHASQHLPADQPGPSES